MVQAFPQTDRILTSAFERGVILIEGIRNLVPFSLIIPAPVCFMRYFVVNR